MNLRLLVPGLFWPQPSLRSIPDPGLEISGLISLARLLARARQEAREEGNSASAFAAALSLDGAGSAVLRAAGETSGPRPQAGETWLCADPVNLAFSREHLLLNPPQSLALNADEAAELEALVRETLSPWGEFHLLGPMRGYLILKQPTSTHFHSLDDAAGRPISLFLPEGDGAREWVKISSEVEIALHNSPLNQRREASGKPAVNSLWFWGSGALPPAVSSMPLVVTDSQIGRGAASVAGSKALPLENLIDTLASSPDELVILIEALEHPVLYHDPQAWLAALLRLEALLFAPLCRALRQGARIEISAPLRDGGPVLKIAPRWFAFWRRPAPLARLLMGSKI